MTSPRRAAEVASAAPRESASEELRPPISRVGGCFTTYANRRTQGRDMWRIRRARGGAPVIYQDVWLSVSRRENVSPWHGGVLRSLAICRHALLRLHGVIPPPRNQLCSPPAKEKPARLCVQQSTALQSSLTLRPPSHASNLLLISPECPAGRGPLQRGAS